MALMENSPTFNVSVEGGISKGYHSRVLFSYSPYENPIDLKDTDVTNVVSTDGIQYLIDNDNPNSSHGSHIIPAYYWKPGKTLRVSGSMIANNVNGGTRKLHMRFGLKPAGQGISWLAIQNNDHDHYFLQEEGPLPVNFSCDIFCSLIDLLYENVFFGASGYFQYCTREYSQNSYNKFLIYTPVWSDVLMTDLGLVGYTKKTTIMFNLKGSDLDDQISITQLTIEELA